MILERAAWALSLLLKLCTLWFLATSVFFFVRPKAFARTGPKTRFAVLLPARNEEAVIGETVRCLLGQHYPRGLFDVFVIPNNCVDGTEAAARRAGAGILRCASPVRCKGDVLHQAIEALMPRGYDAFCVFDADNLVGADFLARMNDAFCAGAKVAKARMLALNPTGSWVASCYALYYGLFECFYNRSRAFLGLSAKLVGTGFAVHREVIERAGGWNTATIAEDAEFSAVCAALGERVYWVPDAVFYDEAPGSFALSMRQRLRWCSGILSAARIKLPALLRALPRVNAARAVDSLFFLCAPFLQVFSLLPTALLFLSAALDGRTAAFLASALQALLFGALGSVLFAALIAVKSGYRVRGMLPGILLFPLFSVSWLPVQLAALFRRSADWKPIPHGQAGRPSAASAALEKSA